MSATYAPGDRIARPSPPEVAATDRDVEALRWWQWLPLIERRFLAALVVRRLRQMPADTLKAMSERRDCEVYLASCEWPELTDVTRAELVAARRVAAQIFS